MRAMAKEPDAAAAVDGGARERAEQRGDGCCSRTSAACRWSSPIRRRPPACSGRCRASGWRSRTASSRRMRQLDCRTKAVVVAGGRARLRAGVRLGRAGEPRGRQGQAPRSRPSRWRRRRRRSPPPVAPPAPVAPPVAAPAPAATKAAAEETETTRRTREDADDEADTAAKADDDSDTSGKAKMARTAPGLAAGADNKRLLAEGERMLRAERFAEARGIFEKLTKSKRERGPALVGLAEFFPGEEIRGRGRKRGGAGGRTRRRREGARAARRRPLPPGALQGSRQGLRGRAQARSRNASAKSGLALANKRM